MNIAVLNYGDPWHVLVSTSLIRGLKRKYPDSNIYVYTSEGSYPVIQYNTKIHAISGYTHNIDVSFDFAINMTPSIEASSFMSELNAKSKVGFIEIAGNVCPVNKEAEEYFAIMYNGENSNRNILQVFYKLCGLIWKGEGYDLSYYPKNKTNKYRTGIAISHDVLRQFVKNNLRLKMSETCSVPIRKNILKRMDEINRCMYVITDDLFILHSSIALRKNVQFLDTTGLSTRIEFFGKGNYYRIAYDEWLLQIQKNRTEENLQRAETSN